MNLLIKKTFFIMGNMFLATFSMKFHFSILGNNISFSVYFSFSCLC